MKPTPGVGQPVDAGIDFQPQVSPIGEQAYWFNHVILLPVITVITLLVLGLMLWAMFRYRAKANPVPSKTTHNTFIEIRSEEHTSELQSLMRISYAVFCLQK